MTIRKEPDALPPYTAEEVATLFRVDIKTVARWRRTGRIPHFLTPGGHGRYPRDTTDALKATLNGGAK